MHNAVCGYFAAVQVATDYRLWLAAQLKVIRGSLHELIRVATDRSAAEVDILMPGFTHLQPAMTVRAMKLAALSRVISDEF